MYIKQVLSKFYYVYLLYSGYAVWVHDHSYGAAAQQ